ncbi:MFS transporter [Marinomonas aquiplantarum]|uniref:Putative MFS family arabinose efflux permease n=1 Tax=Marinomonas aquiplantarum TaxID=491951 RepID=A0A366D287_9GAMM|nr:MFS transporter [Marinomonas aquiplantarum]RBO84182.1 putative MFS family arabinose efflux permease [Marinomonas aquiplantarum]
MTTYKRSTWSLLFSLYATQYVGISFLLVALVAILRSQGMPLEKLSIVYSLGIFWVFRFLWAPLIDRFSLRRFGHYRTWLLTLQAAMIINLFILGLYDLSTDFVLVMSLCATFSFFSATQDVAVDGLACRLLDVNSRGVGNGIQQAGTMFGSLVGSGLVLSIYPMLGWLGCMLLMAGLTGISWLQLIFYKEPTGKVRPQIGYKRLVGFWRYVSKPWLVLLFLYPIGGGMAYAIINPMLVDIGWSLSSIGTAIYLVATPFGIVSALITGKLIQLVGRRKALLGLMSTQALFLLVLLIPAYGVNETLPVYACLITYFIVHSPIPAVLYTLMMDQTDQRTPATDFTIQASTLMLIGIITSGASTALAGAFGYIAVIWMASAMCVVAFIAVWFLGTTHRLTAST